MTAASAVRLHGWTNRTPKPFAGRQSRVEQWLFSSAPPEVRAKFDPFETPRFTRTLSGWLNLMLDTGFSIERLGEPYASDEAIHARPRLVRARVVADFLHVRLRKP